MTRTSRLAALVLLLHVVPVGCASQQGNPPVGGEPSPTSVDFDLIELALLDLMAFDEFHPWTSSDEPRSRIVLDASTIGSSGFISDDQLRGESHGEQEKLVPPEIGGDLRRRNPEKPVSLSEFKPKSPKIVVADLTGVNRQFGEDFEKKYPDARGYAEAWLPGFSNDGKTAIVRFIFGPTAHGATATCMLVRENGRWRVKWRKTAYYV